jgi:hypothetical protein
VNGGGSFSLVTAQEVIPVPLVEVGSSLAGTSASDVLAPSLAGVFVHGWLLSFLKEFVVWVTNTIFESVLKLCGDAPMVVDGWLDPGQNVRVVTPTQSPAGQQNLAAPAARRILVKAPLCCPGSLRIKPI